MRNICSIQSSKNTHTRTSSLTIITINAFNSSVVEKKSSEHDRCKIVLRDIQQHFVVLVTILLATTSS